MIDCNRSQRTVFVLLLLSSFLSKRHNTRTCTHLLSKKSVSLCKVFPVSIISSSIHTVSHFCKFIDVSISDFVASVISSPLDFQSVYVDIFVFVILSGGICKRDVTTSANNSAEFMATNTFPFSHKNSSILSL